MKAFSSDRPFNRSKAEQLSIDVYGLRELGPSIPVNGGGEPVTAAVVSKERFEKEALPYLQEIYASAMRLTRNKEGAEDLASEVYTRAWKSFAQFQPGTNLRAWLYKILTNTYINHYRQKQRAPLMLELDRPADDEGGTGGD